MNNKGEMGVGTLIVFIAMLLVAAVAAGVLLQTSGSLQERALTTGQEAKSQISTHVMTVEVSAEDGRDETLEDFSAIYKLAPGSDPIKLGDTLFTESTKDTTNTLKLRSDGLPVNDVFLGYYTAKRYDFPQSAEPFKDSVPQAFSNTFSPSQTSEMMIGKLAVNIIFIESDGAIDTNTENWTTAEEESIINATAEALNWWGSIEPRAGLRHTFNIYRGVPISYEPITRTTDAGNQTLWITEALDYLGVPAGANIFVRLRAFDEATREEENAHWAFTIFVVDSSETGTGFPDGYAGIAYLNGPHLFIANNAGAFGLYQPALLAHEIGHIFGAGDQYASSLCQCNDSFGYFSIETQNCEAEVCLINQSSIMRGGWDTVTAYNSGSVDIFARAQMGLIDATGNNMLDPVDILFNGDEDADMSERAIEGMRNSYAPMDDRIVGFYSLEYLNSGTNHRDGNLQRGDIMRIRYESARPIGQDEYTRLSLILKQGSVTLTEFVTPDVLSVERSYLYP